MVDAPDADALPPLDAAHGWQAVEDEPEALAHNGRAVTFHVLFGIGGAFLALNFIVGVYAGFVQIFMPDSRQAAYFQDALGAGSTADLFWNTALTFLLIGLIPLLWAYGSRLRPFPGGHRYLGFRDFPRSAAWGLAIAAGLIVSVFVLSTLVVIVKDGASALTEAQDETENPVVQGILDNLTIPLAVFIAFSAGFGEEVLFRGILQKWIGWWPQAIVFGLSHAAGGDPLQLAVTTLIGLLFGWLVRRGWSLWSVVVAHFAYDLGLLLIAKFAL